MILKNSHITTIIIFLFSFNQEISCQTDDITHYHRSSLYSILLQHPEQQFSEQIVEAFKNIPLPDKYNDHNLKITVMNAPVLKKMSKEELEGAYKDAVSGILHRNKIGGRLIEKWFNRDKQTGAFNMNLVKERGSYDASILDIQQALRSARGLAQIEDAGEELLSHTYVLVNDIRYADATLRRNLQGFGVLLGGMAAAFIPVAGSALSNIAIRTGATINDLVVGFKVYVTSYLFRLDWNEDIATEFYSTLWFDSSNIDVHKKQLFNSRMGKYKLTYVGSTTIYSGETSLAGIEHESDMFLKVCTRSIDKAISELQKDFDEFKVYTPLISANPIQAYIGYKEGINENSLYEVLEKSIDSNGRTTYERVGTIKPIQGMIWDNRFMATYENITDANLGYTTFEKVSGTEFFPGMLIRELK